MKYILVNYNSDPSWISEYTDDYFIYDRSDDGIDRKIPADKFVKRENIGHCDYDKLSYLIDNYNDLPEIFFLGKVNLFRHIPKDEFDTIRDVKDFTSVHSRRHKTYMPVCFYDTIGMYYEVNNSWYLNKDPAKYFDNYGQFAKRFQLPNPPYIPFGPGANFFLTRERVHRYGVDYYEGLRSILPYCTLPGEAQMLERSYYTMWKN